MQATFTAAASKEPAAIAAALWLSQSTVAPGAALYGAAAQFIAMGRSTRGDAKRLLQVREALSVWLLYIVSSLTVLFSCVCVSHCTPTRIQMYGVS
jgi:hypothetical protein